MSDIRQILSERGERYGAFDTDAGLAQSIKQTLRSGVRWEELLPCQKEALEMIATKMGRVVNGDPFYVDSWSDICGYAKLVEDILRQRHEQD